MQNWGGKGGEGTTEVAGLKELGTRGKMVLL